MIDFIIGLLLLLFFVAFAYQMTEDDSLHFDDKGECDGK